MKKYQGTVFNTAGDAILASSTARSTRPAVRSTSRTPTTRTTLHVAEHDKLLFRIGIAIGDVLVADDGDLLGDAVNVAARLEHLAEPGGICISDDVRSHVLNKIRLNVVDLGDQNLRNIPRAIRAFKLVSGAQDASGAAEWRCRQLAADPRSPGWCPPSRSLAVLGVAAIAWYLHPWSPELNTVAIAEEPFDPSKIPLVTDRVRESLANYEQEADFKALAISREGWGLRHRRRRRRKRQARGARPLHAARRKRLSAGSTPSATGDLVDILASVAVRCALGAVGGAVHARRRRADQPAVRAQRVEAYLKEKDHKALAVSADGFWVGAEPLDPARRPPGLRSSAARISTRRRAC